METKICSNKVQASIQTINMPNLESMEKAFMDICINTYKTIIETCLPNTENDPWIIISDLYESSNQNEKHRQAKVAPPYILNSINLFKAKVLLTCYIAIPYTWYNERRVESSTFAGLDRALAHHHWNNFN